MRLHHVSEGTGTPVLAVHGWAPDHRLMLGCLEPLFAGRPGYRRIYPDLPGMGRSPAPESVASTEDVLATLHDFVDQVLGETPFLLVGESYGGYLSRALTRDRPGQVLGLALICPIGAVPIHAERTVPEFRVLRSEPDATAGLGAVTAEQFTSMAVVRTAETARRFREEVASGLALCDEALMERVAQRWPLDRSPETGPPFERPTLIMTGRQDQVLGFEDHFPLLPHYPRATFAVLDVAGHNLQIEQPRLFEALMHEWLDRVEAEPLTS